MGVERTARPGEPGDISVFLPVRNGEAWIGQAIRSLLDQTLPPRQILVGDDGSTDGTSSVVEAFGSPALEIFRSEEGLGIPRMCNELIARARHRFLARMDGDDVCLPERFQLQVERLRSSDVALVGSWARRMGASDTLHRVALEHDDIVARMGIHCPIVNPTVMFDRQKLDGLVAYDPQVAFGGDYDLFARLRRKARMANLGRVLLLWRHHERNVGSDPATLDSQNRTVSRVRFSIWTESGIELSDPERSALDSLVRLPLPPLSQSRHLVSAFSKALGHPRPQDLWAPIPALKTLFSDSWNYYASVTAWTDRKTPRTWLEGCRSLQVRANPKVFAKILLKTLLGLRKPA